MSGQSQSSVLQAGEWFKLSVETSGVYQITAGKLKEMGIDPGKINPKHIRIFGRKGGMLPQNNSAWRPVGLVECAVSVVGESDGKFDKEDRILFYAEGPDEVRFDLAKDIFHYQKNIYSDRSFYFLTIGADPGKRLEVAEHIEGSFATVTTFADYAHHELDQTNIERSGREWYGEKFGVVSTHALKFEMAGITEGTTMKVVSDVMAQSYTEASFKLLVNNSAVTEQKIAAVPNGRYSVKGLHSRDTILLNVSDVGASTRTEQEVRYEFVKGQGASQGYLNFVLLSITRNLGLYGDQTIFLSPSSVGNEMTTFDVSNVTDDAQIWETTDHDNVRAQEFETTENGARFSTTTTQLKKWVVFKNAKEPEFVSVVPNQDLLGMPTPNLLVITNPDFRAEAERLAMHRSAHSNWSVLVVTTDEIFNEFSGGRQDVTAMRDYARYLWRKGPGTLKAILLFGKASYDYKDRIFNNTNFVPTYQSRNSLHPLQTYSSDDYFGFLEDGEGDWEESPAQHHSMDVGVGRLPVTSVEEAANVVDKIIHYDTNRKTLGSWRKKIVFVADDGNSEDNFTSLHQYQAHQLATLLDVNIPAVDARRLFMGSYKKHVQPNGETVRGLEDDIKRSFDEGALIINFTGHGSELVWTDERVLTEKTVEELRNERYPFLVTATCEFGRQDDPLLISTAERLVTRGRSGSIGLVTTARPVNATTNFHLNEAFYEALFERTAEGYAPLGRVFQNTKNNSASGVANRNFSLIGDPSMVLAIPEHSITVGSIETASGSDTLKALSFVTVQGTVTAPDGTLAEDFNGVLEATLFDKQEKLVTIGKNDPPFTYEQWNNAVFRGRASVTNGQFEVHFIMPKNIAYQVGAGKLSLYAYDAATGQDAKGADIEVLIGGSESNFSGDETAPSIQLFIGDTTFLNGGVATPDTYLIARFQDENGINISGYGIGNSIMASLDDDAATFVLNDYYVSDVDTYKKGTIRYPLLGLTPGRHSMTVYAWDVNNNAAAATISFIVTDGQELLIESFGNYPNPFQQNTTLFFTHNRSGDDLEAQLFIFNPEGQLIQSVEISIPESDYHVDLTNLSSWQDSGKKLPPGLYFARVIVRSMTNGSKNEKVTKLIVLN